MNNHATEGLFVRRIDEIRPWLNIRCAVIGLSEGGSVWDNSVMLTYNP
jgi:hypothetical protein